MPYAPAGDLRIHYEDLGEGTPILFVHGITGDKWSWIFQVPTFTSKFRVILPDLRCHGKSDKSLRECSVADLASDVSGLLKACEVERAVVCGLSLGGMVAQELALNYPEQVMALILTDTTCSLISEAARKTLEGWTLAFQTPERLVAWYEERLPLLLNDDFLNSPVGRDLVEGRKERLAKADAKAMLAIVRGMMKFDTTDRLERIKQPTLIIVGEEDTVTPPPMSEVIHNKIRGSKFSMIMGSKHVSNADNAAVFNNTVLNFLSKALQA